MKHWKSTVLTLLLLTIAAVAQQGPDAKTSVPSAPSEVASASAPDAAESSPAPASAMTMDQVVDLAIQREHALMSFLRSRTPLVETYLQNLKRDPALGTVPKDDRYFLGRLDLATAVERRDYLSKDDSFEKNMLGGFSKLFRLEYNPTGFSWMIFVDHDDFDRAHYDFKYIRREFLGDVRCFVFEVTPKKDSGKGRFLGRIWVEDEDFNIVRLNGTYAPRPKHAYFFHMDSWRLNIIPGYWLPAYIYSEEGDFSYGSKDKFAFKAQTRIWGYDIKKKAKELELGQITVDSVKDESPAAADPSPLAAQREWQQQAEDNVIDRLQSAGLLAPQGDVDKILLTVVNNLMVTNNLDIPGQIRTRVMLTSPLETFSVGNSIVVSRGLIDVLPDETCLAMVLSHELAHIVLGHNLGSKFAFTDRMLFSDQSTYENFGFRHSPAEEVAADAKALELLKKSPYADKLDSASLFLKALSERAPQLSALLTPHLGNSFVNEKGQLVRMSALSTSGPELKLDKLDQIAALPLGGRLKLNPWNDQVELAKAAPVTIISARDKMPFEVTPFFPHLSRMETSNVTSAAAINRDPQK
jgi:Peptidase family M48